MGKIIKAFRRLSNQGAEGTGVVGASAEASDEDHRKSLVQQPALRNTLQSFTSHTSHDTSATTPQDGSSSSHKISPPIVGEGYDEFVKFCFSRNESDEGELAKLKPTVTEPTELIAGRTGAHTIESRPTPISKTGQCPFRHGTVYGQCPCNIHMHLLQMNRNMYTLSFSQNLMLNFVYSQILQLGRILGMPTVIQREVYALRVVALKRIVTSLTTRPRRRRCYAKPPNL